VTPQSAIPGTHAMEKVRATLPVPAVVANQHTLKLVGIDVKKGAKVKAGDKLATLEGDKASIEFESPADGTVREIHGREGDTLRVNLPFIELETFDPRLIHLKKSEPAPAAKPAPAAPAKSVSSVVWTPRALKLAKEAGLDPATTAIEPTGPGGRVSGDDVTRYLASNSR